MFEDPVGTCSASHVLVHPKYNDSEVGTAHLPSLQIEGVILTHLCCPVWVPSQESAVSPRCLRLLDGQYVAS